MGWIETAAQVNATIQPIEAHEASVVRAATISTDDVEASRRLIGLALTYYFGQHWMFSVRSFCTSPSAS